MVRDSADRHRPDWEGHSRDKILKRKIREMFPIIFSGNVSRGYTKMGQTEYSKGKKVNYWQCSVSYEQCSLKSEQKITKKFNVVASPCISKDISSELGSSYYSGKPIFPWLPY